MSDLHAPNASITAALVWDRPWLNLHGGIGGAAFVGAMDPPPFRLPEKDLSTPLVAAARGIAAERAGDDDEAHARYLELAESNDPWISVLGVLLQCWSAGPHDPRTFDRASELIAATDDPTLRARLLMKLATFALDKQDVERFKSIATRAYEDSVPGTRLRRAIAIATASYAGRIPTQADTVLGPPDPLVDYPWIDDTALQAARGELFEMTKTRARNPWSWTIHMGRTNVDVALSAELQATWAGALWLRDPVRKQLGAMVLAQARPQPYQVLFGLSMWLSARGEDAGPLITAAEPSFSSETADALVLPLLPLRSLPAFGDKRLLDVANSAWDLLSDSTTVAILDAVRPEPADVVINDAARFWSSASLRVPIEWSDRIGELTPPEVGHVLAYMSSLAVDRLEPTVARQLLEKVEGDTPRVEASTGSLLLWHKLGLPVPEGTEVPLDVVVRVGQIKPEALVEPSYLFAEQAARDSLARTVESARGASYGLGDSASSWISTVAIARGAIEPASLDLLLGTSEDALLAPHLRLEAVIAIADLAAHDLVSESVLNRLQRLPELHHMAAFLQPTSDGVFSAATLAARASFLSEEEQLLLFTLSRDPDARARQIVASATARFLQQHESSPVEAALVAALFDPEPSVVNSALRALRTATLTQLSQETVSRRLRRIFERYGRHERVEVVHAVQALDLATEEPQRFHNLLAAARIDRSWIVRNAVDKQSP